jgi:ATP-dependent exoDNAse (exonuclease V) beta subunit
MVILADSAKRLTSQVTSESIKFNKLKDSDDELYNLVGFKVEEHEPLSLRLLKEIDKRKHMAEKKRLYYVALTRPKNHLVISANLKATNSGVGSIGDSYLEMTLDALDLTKEQLFDMEDLPNGYDFIYHNNLTRYPEEEISKKFTIIEPLEPIQFDKQEYKSATAQKSTEVYKRDEALERAALRGTLVHKALELFWNDLDNESRFEQLFIKENITDKVLQKEIKTLSRNFKNTDVYQQLQAGAEALFEFDFEEMIDGEVYRGSIDLLMKDSSSDGWIIVDFKSGNEREAPEYEEQLEFYKKVMEYKGLNIMGCQLCWLG